MRRWIAGAVVGLSIASAQAQELPPEKPVEVTVQARSRQQRTRESAQAVTVVDLSRAKTQSADLGEVLARVQGINVRRAGGLGAYTRFSLNGLTDDQIRFTLDQVPLELAGFPQSIADVPILLLDHVVVYRGVVPARFGADALGGLVDLISTPIPSAGSGGGASYQVGSFGLHRASVNGHYVHAPSGFFARLSGYVDSTRNDYRVDVPVVADDGSSQLRNLKRFHDGYRAYGGALELGVRKRPWAERLMLRAFAMNLERELQSNLIMSLPYGEADYGRSAFGATVRYEQSWQRTLRLDAIVGYSYQPTRFHDQSPWIYDWTGRRVRMRSGDAGEAGMGPIDQTLIDQALFSRTTLAYRLFDGHKLELAFAPTLTLRGGQDHLIAEGRDPLRDDRRMLSMVTGLTYESHWLDDLLENALFAKHYVYRTIANDIAPNGTPVDRNVSFTRFGGGDALRVRILEPLYAKASYEATTRIPRPFETFGDGVLTQAALELKPETSHNGNLELTLETEATPAGRFRGSVNGFLRKVKNQIVRIGAASNLRYQNIFDATSRGVEANAGWTTPGDWVELDGNVTFVDLRNDSKTGTFAMFEGDRIPNRPYLFANASARGVWREVFASADELSLSYYLRYVHEFYRGWESAGIASSRQTIPSQTAHSLVLAYLYKLDALQLTGALEVQNLTDAALFDEYGAQRPGRGYYFKLTAQR